MVLMGNLFSNFLSFICFFGAIFELCPWFDQSQPDDGTDVEITELCEFDEGMKVGVVFQADFIADLAILAFFCFTASLRLAMLYRSNRAETLLKDTNKHQVTSGYFSSAFCAFESIYSLYYFFLARETFWNSLCGVLPVQSFV